MRRAAIVAVSVPALVALLGYWVWVKTVEAVGNAVDNIGDISFTEDWTWDDWDEWDGL